MMLLTEFVTISMYTLFVNSDGRPLSEERIATQIVESLCREILPSEWMLLMRAWHIT
jgi:hypothetical protein